MRLVSPMSGFSKLRATVEARKLVAVDLMPF